jgi:hypothetical protein
MRKICLVVALVLATVTVMAAANKDRLEDLALNWLCLHSLDCTFP